MKNNKPLRLLAGGAGIILIILLLILTMSLTGNPISKVLATRTADKYVEDNYSDQGFIRDETYYNFKFTSYAVEYYKGNSKDIHFNIETDYLGRLNYDGYQEAVLSKWNTRMRLNDEFNDYVEKLLRDNLDYDYNMINADNLNDENSENLSKLEIDMVFDFQNIALDHYLTIYIYEENRTLEKVEEVILEVDDLMEEYNLDISRYSIILEEPRDENDIMGENLGVFEFPKEYIDSENLPERLKEFYMHN